MAAEEIGDREWRLIGTVHDADGIPVRIDQARDIVRLTVTIDGDELPDTVVRVHMDGDARDAFMHAWADAEHQAEREAHVTPTDEVVEVDIWCGIDGCVNGPNEHLWLVTCRNVTEAREMT